MSRPETATSPPAPKPEQGSCLYLCPNCARRFPDLTAAEQTESGCFLGMLTDVVLAREDVSPTSAQIAAFEDVDGLWDRFGSPVADELEAALRLTDTETAHSSESDHA